MAIFIMVKAIDTASNTSTASVTVSVTMNKVAPETTIDSGPLGPTGGTTIEFCFSRR
jgi:hypothetical protein